MLDRRGQLVQCVINQERVIQLRREGPRDSPITLLVRIQCSLFLSPFQWNGIHTISAFLWKTGWDLRCSTYWIIGCSGIALEWKLLNRALGGRLCTSYTRRYPNKQIGGSELKTSECCPTPRSRCCQRYRPAACGKKGSELCCVEREKRE